LDSPAYSNLTTSYLQHHFNPSTPNREGVRYFSLAARKDGEDIGIFHPLWLPKVILDECEKLGWNQDSKASLSSLQAQYTSSSAPEDDSMIGNDGLVTIASATWGEFLGVVEDADHWDIRGATGFVGEWEKAGKEGNLGWSDYWKRKNEGVLKDSAESGSGALKSVSDAMDWIVDRLPKRENGSTPSTAGLTEESLRITNEVEKKSKRDEDEGEFDLERVYVAICRKLYDEGF
jgi:hypothetical protein